VKLTPNDMKKVSLLISQSHSSTSANNTGSWSFIQPGYQEKTSPCSEACPCAEDIPRIEMLAAEGRFAAAWRLILAENPLPGVCGRVCFHRCEAACNRRELDEGVAINGLERFLADTAFADGLSGNGIPADGVPDPGAGGLTPRAPTGKKVAVVGSGPAGLAAAYFLARLGYECDILESGTEAGGVLRSGIPAYRLPPDVLDREVDRVKAQGVRIVTGQRIDEAFLRAASKRYNAIFIACGHSRPLKLDVQGEELAEDALSLLADAREGRARRFDGPGSASLPIAVIGGGNTAIDAARSLKRLGASSLIVYRRRREDMPAFGKEVGDALAEGVKLMELYAPVAISRAETGCTLTLQRMRSAETGPDGRARVLPVQGETSELRVGAIYAAIGAGAAESWMLPAPAAKAHKLGHCVAEWKAASGIPFLYGGDLVNDVESVADALASGKEAAMAIDTYFAKGTEAVEAELSRCRIGGGDSLSMEIHLGGSRAARSARVVSFANINADYFAPAPRAQAPRRLAPADAATGFAEVEGGFDPRTAMAQAERCFNCGICNGCDNCRTFCPEVAVTVATDLGGGGAGRSRQIDKNYCKGCGVCVTECPRNAMTMEGSQS
jgi:NADPH-dependent glutamate synthase beta subunit-like oxidoreductase